MVTNQPGSEEAIDLQLRLRHLVRIEPLAGSVLHMAGCDVAYYKFSSRAFSAVVVLRLPSLELVAWSSAIGDAAFQYTPGLLSFREIPLLIEAWERLDSKPDVVMVDGQGLAHPRRFGLACHLGVLLDKPCFGCAKTRFVGQSKEPKLEAGNYEYLVDQGEVVGAVVRTRDAGAPVYVSPGHLIDVGDSIRLTLEAVRTSRADGRREQDSNEGIVKGKALYRLPEPTRLANILANALRRGESGDAALRTATRIGR